MSEHPDEDGGLFTSGTPTQSRPMSFLGHSAQGAEPAQPEKAGWDLRGQEAVMRIPVSVRVVLGATRMPVSKLMSLARGSIIPLDRKVGDLVDIVVNDRLVARGEVVVLDDAGQRFGVAVRELGRLNDG
jgi:flagellar motor switch protein FliN/FliY